MSDIICRTVGELKQVLTELPDDLPFEVYHKGQSWLGRSWLTDFLVLRGIWDGKGAKTLIIDADDDTPTPQLDGWPAWPDIVPIPEYRPTATGSVAPSATRKEYAVEVPGRGFISHLGNVSIDTPVDTFNTAEAAYGALRNAASLYRNLGAPEIADTLRVVERTVTVTYSEWVESDLPIWQRFANAAAGKAPE